MHKALYTIALPLPSPVLTVSGSPHIRGKVVHYDHLHHCLRLGIFHIVDASSYNSLVVTPSVNLQKWNKIKCQ